MLTNSTWLALAHTPDWVLGLLGVCLFWFFCMMDLPHRPRNRFTGILFILGTIAVFLTTIWMVHKFPVK